MAILIALAVILMLAGGIFYNKLRASVYGIIGVGGSYMATIGIMMLFLLLGSLFTWTMPAANITELIVSIIFMLGGVGYLVYVMLTRCQTVMQRVLLPVIAVMIAFGFCWRFVLMLVLKIPMGNGEPAAAAAKFPASVTDDQGDVWTLVSDSGDHAEYECRKTGDRHTVWYTGDYVALPAGWRAN